MNITLIEQLSKVEQARLLGKMDKVQVKQHDTIFFRGEFGNCMYLVMKGEVGIYVNTTDGKEQLIASVHEGETFGEMALLTGEPRSATVLALTDVDLYVVTQEVFEELITTHVAFANYFTRLLCDRLYVNNQQLSEMKRDQTQYIRNKLNEVSFSIKQVIMYSTLLQEVQISFLEHYFQQTNLKDKLEKLFHESPLITVSNNNLVISSIVFPIVKEIADEEIAIEEKNAFLEEAETYFLDQEDTDRLLVLLSHREKWNDIFVIMKSRNDISEDTFVAVLDKCPDGELFNPLNCESMMFYFKKKLEGDITGGFVRLETLIDNGIEQFEETKQIVFYELMAEFCHILGFESKAVDYLHKAMNLISDSDPEVLASYPVNKVKSSSLVEAKRKLLQVKYYSDRPKKHFQLLKENNLFSKIISLVGLSILCFFVFFPPFQGFTSEMMIFVGMTLTAVLFWITDIVPDYLVSLFMCMGWVLFGLVTPQIAFSGFSSPIWFFIIFLFVLGTAISASGIMYRASLYLLKIFPKTFRGQLTGLALTGLLINPLIPSGMAKAMLATPISLDIAKALGYQNLSKGIAGLVLSGFLIFVYMNPFFLTAGISNFIALGLIDGYDISFLAWAWYAFPGLIIFIIGTLAFSYLLFQPDEKQNKISNHLINEQLKVLGTLSKNERISIAVMIFVVGLLVTQPIHGVNGIWIVLVGVATFVLTNVVDRQMVRQSLDVTALLHIGVALSFAQVAASVGASEWMASKLLMFLEPFTFSPYLFLPVLAVFIFLISFFMDALPAMILLLASLLPLFELLQYNPWVLIFIVLLTTGPFFLPYQSEIYLSTYYATEGKAFTHQQGRKMAYVYALLTLIIIIVSIPFWKSMGLL